MGFVFGFGVSFGVPGVALVSAFSILVQVPCNKEESTSSGLIVAGREAAENPTQGRVLAVGPGAFDRHNQRVPMEVETKRICSEISASRERKRTRAGSEKRIVDNGEHFLLIHMRDVLAKW
eukprot:GHVT01102249.1.p2 GENE.GHVT01102249.1~~GHVT01102249.1.p2  ORF type:complete len:121 (+),score=15.29 GHVT01102249.1:828-1190(+)